MQHILLIIVIYFHTSGAYMYAIRKFSLIFLPLILALFAASCDKNGPSPKEPASKELSGKSAAIKDSTENKESYVKTISGLDNLNSIVDSTPGRLLVFDLYADWCMPCKILAPLYDTLAKDHKEKANFYRVDVQKHQDIAAAFKVQGIPLVLSAQ
jgi:thiol-disulfide isomerase/thioredoxin